MIFHKDAVIQLKDVLLCHGLFLGPKSRSCLLYLLAGPKSTQVDFGGLRTAFSIVDPWNKPSLDLCRFFSFSMAIFIISVSLGGGDK